MEGTLNTKFLGLQTHKKWNLKKHIEEIIKLSGACYAVKAMFLIINTNSLKSIYFACFFFCNKVWNDFLDNLSSRGKIFTFQKKTISIMVGAKPRTSCRSLMEEIRDFTYKHICFTDPVSVNRWLNMKQANVNSRRTLTCKSWHNKTH